MSESILLLTNEFVLIFNFVILSNGMGDRCNESSLSELTISNVNCLFNVHLHSSVPVELNRTYGCTVRSIFNVINRSRSNRLRSHVFILFSFFSFFESTNCERFAFAMRNEWHLRLNVPLNDVYLLSKYYYLILIALFMFILKRWVGFVVLPHIGTHKVFEAFE